MSVRLAELAEMVGGALTGDGQLLITGAATLHEAGPGQITLVDRKCLMDQLSHCRAAAAVVAADMAPAGKAYIAVDDARSAFAHIVRRFRPQREPRRYGISPAAHVSPTALVANNVDIYPGVFIGDDVHIGPGCCLHPGAMVMPGCRLGEDVTLFPNVVLYENTVVGNRVTIHANAVIGAYGFGYELTGGRHQSAPQLGNVEIEDDVEIGAGTTIDRGTFGSTRIGEGTKIDNLVMIGHNCRIGRHNIFCAQVGIAGSCTTGDYVIMGGQVGVRDHLKIADGVMIGAQSGVGESLTEAGKYLGTPAIPARKEIQILHSQQKLPEMHKRLNKLEAIVARQEGPECRR
jgi:UDP-3-O-[3-hydroxymyristoyl] glucosamine N-acyltransferase